MLAVTPSLASSSSCYMGLAHLMRQHMAGAHLAPVAQQLIEQASVDATQAGALMDAALILQFYEHEALALQLQQEALKVQTHFRIPSARPTRLRLLVLMAPGKLMVNAPIECLLEDGDIQLDHYFLTHVGDDLSRLPPHDVLFVAICETEANRPLLQALQQRLAHWPCPVLNQPQHISRMARDTAARLLAPLPGVFMPPTRRLPRQVLNTLAGPEGIAQARRWGLQFPLIVRPLDSHAGNDLHKVSTPAELGQVLTTLPGDEGFIAPFIDYRSPDGQFRKYRIMLVNGRPYIAHGAISSHWMIHYLNAGMASDATKRAEEAAFMATFDTDFVPRHTQALQAIHQAMGVNYLGIDCAETTDGRLLIFEVDHGMVAHAMDPIDVYPYKPPVMQKLFSAFRDMLFAATGRPTPALT